MNLKYYVSPEEAEKVTNFLNKHLIGGGVAASSLNEFVGPVSVPQVPGKLMLNLKLKSGAEMNAGLTLDLMGKGYAEWLVVAMLEQMAKPAPQPKDD